MARPAHGRRGLELVATMMIMGVGTIGLKVSEVDCASDRSLTGVASIHRISFG
ncbi:hypothetical protein ABIF68_003945 [Bradyrhizobium japonicum]|nr:hypothetical protein [Bradyrhizobium japonicum]